MKTIEECMACVWREGMYCTRPDVTISATHRTGRSIRYVDIEPGALPCTAVVAAKKWGRERNAALEREREAKQAYFERSGLAEQYRADREAFLVSGEKWRLEKRQACERSFGERRRYGDKRIFEAIVVYEATHSIEGEEPHKLTPSFKDILVAIIELCSDSGVLYASASSIAKKAGRSKSSVDTYMKKFEELYFLNRKSSGGKDMRTGKTASNRYEINYDVIRAYLRVGTWSQEDKTRVLKKAIQRREKLREANKAHWNRKGYARHSESQRAKQKREDNTRQTSAEPVKKTIEFFTGYNDDIGFDQQFWALSIQSTKKEQKRETLRVFHKPASLLPAPNFTTGITKIAPKSQLAGQKERVEDITRGVLLLFMHRRFSTMHMNSVFMHKYYALRFDWLKTGGG